MSKVFDELKNFDHLPDSALIPDRDVMQLLRISRSTVWRMVNRGELEAIKVGLRSTRFRVGQVREILGGGPC